MKVSAILLAGGKGLRMQSDQPKQYLQLGEKPISLYSFEILLSIPEIVEIIVVCDPFYRHIFSSSSLPIHFALPGTRRQDSTFNGFQAVSENSDLVLIHDAARPFISISLVQRALETAVEYGAATVGMPLKFTVKEINQDKIVQRTPNRNFLWEIQTPQVIRPQLLKEGFDFADKHQLSVTDDVSLIELIGHPVKIVEGSYSNIKITTQDDLILAQRLLETPVHA